MRALGAEADRPGRAYLVGGASAVLFGWRERSPFIAREGRLDFHHDDLCAQALAKIERGHTQDRADVSAMLARGLVTRAELRDRFAAIEPFLHRFPAIDPPTFRRAVEAIAEEPGGG